MKNPPPLTDAILFAISRLVDDAQTGAREPSHSDMESCILRCKLGAADPKAQGQTVGKAKRVRAVLNWAIENDFSAGQEFVEQFIGLIRGCGGFRPGSPNYVGEDAISTLRGAMVTEGFVLTSDGELHPTVLESFGGVEMTEALLSYVRRAQKGSIDAALLAGTSKDLLEATAAHVLQEIWGTYSSATNFPTLLGQAFVALGLKTPAETPANGEPPQHRFQRALYEAACAVNTLRNKQGTGHGRPWLPSVTDHEARQAVQVMGTVSEMLLTRLKAKK